jgi:hypothetical protein
MLYNAVQNKTLEILIKILETEEPYKHFTPITLWSNNRWFYLVLHPGKLERIER